MTLHGQKYEAFLSQNWLNKAFKHTNIYITKEHAIDDEDEEFLETLPKEARHLSYKQFMDNFGKPYYDYLLKEMQKTHSATTSLQQEQSSSS